jgi:hypothetical protein
MIDKYHIKKEKESVMIKNKKKMFKFTSKSLKRFDEIFSYNGKLEDGLWAYENPYKIGTDYESYDNSYTFFVQVGGGGVEYIDGWKPDGMSFNKIVNKLKSA